ncbi:MAG TPA: NTP transferase domain-containing protein [Candidatus Nanoarchaeia archaeon]|nr:NTP transferase domain-containing protein [Candidatus Nanoarchaeia archaeon]
MKNSDYQVIILAAGESKRLKELTPEKPKFFLEINNKKIIEYHFDALSERGFKEATLVVGFKKELVMETFRDKYKNINIDYVDVDPSTNHGWGTFATRERWLKGKKPIFFIHADVFCDSKIFGKVIDSKFDNVVSVDNKYTVKTGDEMIITGKNNKISSLVFYKKNIDDVVGELIGINKFSSEFFEKFYDYLKEFVEKNGKGFNYEVILNEFIKKTGMPLHYVTSDGLAWMNINYKEDYLIAKEELYNKIYGN